MSGKSIEESIEYVHLIAQGIPEDPAWCAVWIDRAYKHLVRNGMAGAEAYAQAVATFAAALLDIETMEPEAVITTVLEQGHRAQERYPRLDPAQPEASFILQHQPEDQGKPS